MQYRLTFFYSIMYLNKMYKYTVPKNIDMVYNNALQKYFISSFKKLPNIQAVYATRTLNAHKIAGIILFSLLKV